MFIWTFVPSAPRTYPRIFAKIGYSGINWCISGIFITQSMEISRCYFRHSSTRFPKKLQYKEYWYLIKWDDIEGLFRGTFIGRMNSCDVITGLPPLLLPFYVNTLFVLFCSISYKYDDKNENPKLIFPEYFFNQLHWRSI